MVPLAEIWFGIDSVYPHLPHHTADLLSVYAKLIITPDNLGNHPIAPGRMSRMQFIDSAHNKQVLIRDGSLFRRVTVDAASVDAEEISLSTDVELCILEINESFSSSWVRGFLQIFFSTS